MGRAVSACRSGKRARTRRRRSRRRSGRRTEVHVGDKVPRPRCRHLDPREGLCDLAGRFGRPSLSADRCEVDAMRSSLGRGGLKREL